MSFLLVASELGNDKKGCMLCTLSLTTPPFEGYPPEPALLDDSREPVTITSVAPDA